MRFLIFSFLVVFAGSSFAQSFNIRGKVNGDDGAIPGATILIMGTTKGASTDTRGNYSIEDVNRGSYKIRFSALGYKTIFKDITLADKENVTLNAQLDAEDIELDEVQIIGKNMREASDTKTSVIDLSPRSAKVLAGAGEDVLRTLQSLPGVLAPNDFSSQLVIRGSGPDQNLIVIDGVEIFNPYRLYGAVSMFNPDAVEDISLITGGFPAKYGDRLSAVLDVTSREGTTSENLRGSLNASIISANIVVEGKNPLGVKGSWLFNSRRTYYDLIIGPFAKSAGLVEDNVNFPNFYDVQTKLVFGPFSGHKFLFTGILSADGVDVISGKERITPDSVSVNNITKNDVVSGSWHWALNKNTLNKMTFSWYRNNGITGFDSQVLDPSLNRDLFSDGNFDIDTLSSYLLGVRFDSDFEFTKLGFDDRFTYLWGDDSKNVLEAGFGYDRLETLIRFDFEFDPFLQSIINSNPNARVTLSDINSTRTYDRYRAYVQNTFEIGSRFYLTPSLRYDYYEILRKPYYAPRISASFIWDDLTTLRAVYGIYYQSPGYEKLRDQNLIMNFEPQFTGTLEAEKATHYVIGIERWLTPEWNLRLEGYYKDIVDLIEPQLVQGSRYFSEIIPGRDPKLASSWTRPVTIPSDSVTQIPFNQSYGEAYGFEVLLAKQNRLENSSLNGWVSYALAFANRYEDGRKLPFRFDQRHTLNIVLDYTIDNVWNVGARWQYGTGFPTTEPIGIRPRIQMVDTDGDFKPDAAAIATRRSITDPNNQEVMFDIDFGVNNRFNARKPDYHRLDIRVSANANFWNMKWNFYLDVVNVYNRSNVVGYNYYINNDLTIGRDTNTMFPILPTLGFSVRF